MKKVLFFALLLLVGCHSHFILIYRFGSEDQKSYDNLELGIPGPSDQIVEREGYALGYSRKYKQPLWVSYRLTKDEVLTNVINRTNNFCPDPCIEGGSALTEDYWNSGYDRGHLAPAADMHWSTNTMLESFYMSNMSPQTPELNRRTWMYLESFVRDSAVKEGSIFIVTGPIITNEVLATIGKNNVTVPDAFYKVLYDETPPEKMLAFVVPNNKPDPNFWLYVTNVVYAEELTGLNFFSGVDTNKQEMLKCHINTNDWARYP